MKKHITSPEFESWHRTGREVRANDYSQNPFPAVCGGILIAIGIVAGLHLLVSQAARWLMPMLLLVALASAPCSAQTITITHAMWFYHQEHPETTDQHHGWVYDLHIPVGWRMYAHTVDAAGQWSKWQWVDNIQHNIKPERGDTVAHSYHTRETIMTVLSTPAVGIEFAFAGGHDEDVHGNVTLKPIECVAYGAWAWGVPDEVYLVTHPVIITQLYAVTEDAEQTFPTFFAEMDQLSVVVTGP